MGSTFCNKSLILFYAVFIKLIKNTFLKKHPLVLHVDSRHYEDKEILDMIEALINDTSMKHRIFVSSHLDDDVDRNN